MLKKIYSWGILTLERERNYISEQLVSISLLGTQPAEVTAKINTRFSYAATDLFPHTQFKQNSWEQRYRFDSAPYSTYPTERIQNNKNIYILKGERYISYVFPQNWNSYSLFWWNWILKVFKWCTQLPKYIHCTHFIDNRKKRSFHFSHHRFAQHSKGKLAIILEVKSNWLDVTEGSYCSHICYMSIEI